MYKAQTILDQLPKAGTPLRAGDGVKVLVSRGPLKMPDFKDQTLEEVKSFAGDKGINMIIEYVVTDAYEPGTILRQVPAADTLVTDQVLTLELAKTR